MDKPWRCPKHPNAQIIESWDEKHPVMNGYPVGLGVKSNFKCECAECGLELMSEEEAEALSGEKKEK